MGLDGNRPRPWSGIDRPRAAADADGGLAHQAEGRAGDRRSVVIGLIGDVHLEKSRVAGSPAVVGRIEPSIRLGGTRGDLQYPQASPSGTTKIDGLPNAPSPRPHPCGHRGVQRRNRGGRFFPFKRETRCSGRAAARGIREAGSGRRAVSRSTVRPPRGAAAPITGIFVVFRPRARAAARPCRGRRRRAWCAARPAREGRAGSRAGPRWRHRAARCQRPRG